MCVSVFKCGFGGGGGGSGRRWCLSLKVQVGLPLSCGEGGHPQRR